MIDVIFSQAQLGTPDPTAALIAAMVVLIGTAVASVWGRFHAVWTKADADQRAMESKAENDRLNAAIEAADRRCEQRCNECEKRCRELDNRLWLMQESVRRCGSSDCPLRPSLPTIKGPS